MTKRAGPGPFVALAAVVGVILVALPYFGLVSLICCVGIWAPFALLLLIALPTSLEVRVVLAGVLLVMSVPLMFWGVIRDRRASTNV
jgi:hypothetical protein